MGQTEALRLAKSLENRYLECKERYRVEYEAAWDDKSATLERLREKMRIYRNAKIRAYKLTRSK